MNAEERKQAEEIIAKEFPLAIVDDDEWTGGLLKCMKRYAALKVTEVEKRMPTEEEAGKLAEEYADSVDRRGCSYWNGMYRGYKRAFEDIRSRMEGRAIPTVISNDDRIRATMNKDHEQDDSDF